MHIQEKYLIGKLCPNIKCTYSKISYTLITHIQTCIFIIIKTQFNYLGIYSFLLSGIEKIIQWYGSYASPKETENIGLHTSQGKRELLKAWGNLETSLAEVNVSWASSWEFEQTWEALAEVNESAPLREQTWEGLLSC